MKEFRDFASELIIFSSAFESRGFDLRIFFDARLFVFLFRVLFAIIIFPASAPPGLILPFLFFLTFTFLFSCNLLIVSLFVWDPLACD